LVQTVAVVINLERLNYLKKYGNIKFRGFFAPESNNSSWRTLIPGIHSQNYCSLKIKIIGSMKCKVLGVSE